MPKFTFNKLVRDKLPDVYKTLQQKITVRELSSDLYSEALCAKLVEEAEELPGVNDRRVIMDELADVQQVVDDLMACHGISKEQLQKIQSDKKAQKGGFTNGVFVETIELKNNDKWVGYYRKNPKKYPEL